MPDPNLGQVAASVWESVIGKKPTDNILNSRALFFFLGEKGFKEDVSGGRLIEFPLMYAENSTFKSYSETEDLDTTRVDVFDCARFEWKINAGTVVYSELERLRAAAAARKFDVIAEKLENGKDSHIAAMNRQLHGDGTGNSGKDIEGIRKLISSTPTTGTVGQLNRATLSWARNRQNSGAQTSSPFDNLRSAMRTTKNQCSSGGVKEAPTAWITDRTSFEGYMSLLDPQERYNKESGQRGGDLGWDQKAISFEGAMGFWDEDSYASELRFFNPKYMKLAYLSGGWMKMYPEVDPANQLSNVHKVATFGNMGINNGRRLGVVTAIS